VRKLQPEGKEECRVKALPVQPAFNYLQPTKPCFNALQPYCFDYMARLHFCPHRKQ